MYVLNRAAAGDKTIFIESLNPKGLAGLLANHFRARPYWARRLVDPLWLFCDFFTLFPTAEVIRCLAMELKRTVSPWLSYFGYQA